MSTLGQAAEFLSGGTPKKGIPEFWGGSISWYSASNMTRRFLKGDEPKITEAGLAAGSRLAPAGSTLLLVRGSGLFNSIPICFADEPVAFNQDVKAICARSHVDPLFLHFWIESLRRKLNENIGVTGIGAGKFDLGFLQALPFPDISKGEQERIGRLASLFDRKIDLNHRLNETLEAMARAIFKDWFVDFGPTRAKIEGRAPYLVPDIWALFPERLDDERKPEGWKTGCIADIIEINPTEALKRGERAPYLDMAALPTDGATPNLPLEREFTSGMKFRNGDTLLARITPCLENGKTAFVQCLKDNTRGWGSTEFIVMRARSPVPSPISYILARDPSFRRHAIQSMTGTSGRQRVRAEAVEQYPLILPTSNAIWQAFGWMIDPIFEKITVNAGETRALAATRDLLLPKLMSGEIRIKDAEKIIGEVV